MNDAILHAGHESEDRETTGAHPTNDDAEYTRKDHKAQDVGPGGRGH